MVDSSPGLRVRFARRADRLLSRFGLVEPRPDAPAPVPVPVRTEAAPKAAPQAAPAPAAAPRPAAGGLDEANVRAVLDDMVRPALQSDGGDLTLLKVDGGDVYVKLVGACSSCPSSTLTMKMGIERLLEEELVGFERLIQVT